MNCDPGVAEIILGFSIGGIGLRVAIAWLKDKLNVAGILALLLSIACCAVAVAVYMAIAGWAWTCFIFWTGLVFTGTQVVYRATKKK